jgi:phosphatidate cytidylyltransferase
VVRYNKERELPLFRYFYAYWFIVAAFFLYTRTLLPHLLVHELPWALRWVLRNHVPIAFTLYMAGFMAFVVSLSRRKHYKYQFGQFAYCHLALIFVVAQSTSLVSNVFAGLIWFAMPQGMVVCNDTFAYICGKSCGRTRLLRLSPNKTWEGFIGSFIITMIWSFFFCGLLQQFPTMTCPKMGLSLSVDCQPSDPALDLYTVQPLSSFLPAWVGDDVGAAPEWTNHVRMSSMQIHCVVMSVFASLVAPFGGFFASGFKRAFRIKDFADTIPGHGGFTDRMDCQIVMGMFAYIYFHYVIAPSAAPWGSATVGGAMVVLMRLTRGQQETVLRTLAGMLGFAVLPEA